MVLRQGLWLAVVGAAVGLVGALIVSHLMAGLLFGLRPTDPLTFVGVALLLTAVALAACYIPARRAMRLDPLVALSMNSLPCPVLRFQFPDPVSRLPALPRLTPLRISP